MSKRADGSNCRWIVSEHKENFSRNLNSCITFHSLERTVERVVATRLNGCAILVVEDEPLIAVELVDALEAEGALVYSARRTSRCNGTRSAATSIPSRRPG